MSHTTCEFSSAFAYIESVTELTDKIERINLIIKALEDAALKFADTSGIEEYTLDDGQIKIKRIYRSIDEIFKSIDGFEKVKQRYVNRLQGHSIQLRPRNNHC